MDRRRDNAGGRCRDDNFRLHLHDNGPISPHIQRKSWYSPMVGFSILVSLTLLFVWQTIPVEQYWVFDLMAILTLTGYIFMIQAFHVGDVSVVASYEYSVLPGGFLWRTGGNRSAWGMTVQAICYWRSLPL